jgi:hypothetical protein
MDRTKLWAMAEAARPAGAVDCAQHAARLLAALAELPTAEILAYQHLHDQLMAESYHWDLWGAAYLLNFGCSDDGFDYFRGWLLTRNSWFWCQDILGVAYEAYQRRTGQPITPQNVCDMFGAGPPRATWSPGGEPWDPEDDQQMRQRWPRLFAWHQLGMLQ